MAWREIEDLTGESFSRRTAQSQRISVICPSTEERIMFHPQLYECFAAQTYHDKEGWTEVDARMDSSTGHFRSWSSLTPDPNLPPSSVASRWKTRA
ncbi:unnamed protein product [Effrenium voratum]|nr:unnamed protein product [Effrenium voratum]